MQSFQTNTASQSGPKNYVFVDEHNRHKRLKVMRACEGCRRRKIRCDSATTNTWPCAACVRLKLHCVPPVGGVDGDFGPAATGPVDFQNYNPSPSDITPTAQAFPSNYPGQTFEEYGNYGPGYTKSDFYPQHDPYQNLYGQQLNDGSLGAFQSGPYQPVRADSDGQGHARESPVAQYTAEDLSQHLGDLKINENGIAPYIRQQTSDDKEPEAPIQDVQDPEFKITAFSTDAGSQIRIPPALMPDDEDALEYFNIFFRDVHPYVPVLCKSQFYHQWHNKRSSISPLLLEAIFACAGRMSDDPAQGAQWLALANRHEPCFLDTPRLSTVQALLILMKARESAPKRGYYYRSWMLCKTTVSMAKDLDLHEHHEIHEAGEDCGSEPVECLIKTRIWQACLIVEMMVGAPQGRTDMSVDPDSVDISPDPPCSDIDDYERLISRQYAYFLRNARNIRLITEIARKLKRKEDWGLDKDLIAYNVAFRKWPDELPLEFRVEMSANGAVPRLQSHFVGNMHSHYHLGVVMLRRAQLTASEKFANDEAWKQHMSACYRSAKILCRLQEAILAQYDLAGLLVMQRGINFTIYAILTCVMIHLIAITSPDPEFHTDARDYFVRHMRILERCVLAWPMPETEAQINALRSAFSADIHRPFELKGSFPLGSPGENYHSSPTSQPDYSQHSQQQQPHVVIPQTQAYIAQQMGSMQQGSYLATPPVSAVSDSKPQSPLSQHAYDMNSQNTANFTSMPPNPYYQPNLSPHDPPPQWNPTPIINQFNTAFSIPASALAPPGAYGNSPPIQMPAAQNYLQNTPSPPYPAATTFPPSQQHQAYYAEMQQRQQQHDQQQGQQGQAQYMGSPNSGMPQQQQQQQQQQIPPQAAAAYRPPPDTVYVTPKQWQQSVASVYDGGLKRRWDYMQQGGGGGGESMAKRR